MNHSRSELGCVMPSNYAQGIEDDILVTYPSSVSPKMPRVKNVDGYNPFEHRNLAHPTTDGETLIHLLKGSLGSGILAMPLAFANAGLWFGLISTFIVGLICTYCLQILVECAHTLCRRTHVPSLGFADVAEAAFLSGPHAVRQWSKFARFIINAFLVIDLIGCCCVYIVFVATNVQQVMEYYSHIELDLRWYILSLLLPLILINMIRNLKHMAPCSMVANIFMGVGLAITLYQILGDLPSVTERPFIADWHKLPMFFGTVIFALECVGVIMSLENNMKTPQNFIGCPGVLNVGMGFVIILYASVGFLGYLKFGEETQGSISLNLPVEHVSAQLVKLLIAIAIFLTYALQFYVPMEIIWKSVEGNFSDDNRNAANYAIRVMLVALTVFIAIAVPQIGPFVSLIGAVCLSTLGLVFPSIIEMVTYWDERGLSAQWRFWKNVLLISFGVVGFVTGTYVSLLEMAEAYTI